MSVEGIQIWVDGVAEATVAARPLNANAASAIPSRWMILPLFFMVPPERTICRAAPGRASDVPSGETRRTHCNNTLKEKEIHGFGAAEGEGRFDPVMLQKCPIFYIDGGNLLRGSGWLQPL